MKRLLIAMVLMIVSATACYAESDGKKTNEEEAAVTAPVVKKITTADLVGKTITFTWQTGPFKNAANIIMFVDPNTMKLSVESGKDMANPSTIKFDTVQIDNEIFLLTWRSEEYAQTLVMTLNFKTHMIYEVVVTEKTNYLSQGPFVLKE
ncbi:hypothetical protein [Halodesulfovibrio sp.]|jgi:hypothetical protein|uniref:hypothetical protein n=1 Tax=Halodesulfovibrio sp. TaxID=1912772 RepID=UPI0025D8F3B8|nr:hypothetical protein [Halodesulfovibrio sp.]MCT4534315.1 hypothetical protein [Halodesulfovibrio sp.]MCT4625791.1 hypothetical protein [Halodesulfovibrio sp.]